MTFRLPSFLSYPSLATALAMGACVSPIRELDPDEDSFIDVFLPCERRFYALTLTRALLDTHNDIVIRVHIEQGSVARKKQQGERGRKEEKEACVRACEEDEAADSVSSVALSCTAAGLRCCFCCRCCLFVFARAAASKVCGALASVPSRTPRGRSETRPNTATQTRQCKQGRRQEAQPGAALFARALILTCFFDTLACLFSSSSSLLFRCGFSVRTVRALLLLAITVTRTASTPKAACV